MNNTNFHKDAAIAQTRKILSDLKSEAPSGIPAYVIDLALAYEDPLNFWGEYCDAAFIKTNMISIAGDELQAFYDEHRTEIDTIKDQCLSSPHGTVSYEPDFLVRFAIENTAFQLRHQLDV